MLHKASYHIISLLCSQSLFHISGVHLTVALGKLYAIDLHNSADFQFKKMHAAQDSMQHQLRRKLSPYHLVSTVVLMKHTS